MKGNQNISINEPDANGESPINKDFLSRLTVRSSDFALKYLETTDISKPQYNRLISWFYKIKILPENPSQWNSKLNGLISKYDELIKTSGFVDSSQLDEMNKELPAIIPRDLKRSFKLFPSFLESLNLQENIFTESQFRIHRIFYLLHNNCPEFDYLQGYDRFIYFCTCISLSFCDQIKLNADAVEAFAYYASYYFISYVSIAKEVLDPDSNLLIMSDLSDFLQKWSAPTASAFKYQNLKCDIYAMNYLLLLFAEQHKPSETLVLWDLILLHTNFENKQKGDQKKKEFIYALMVAHLVQVQIGVNASETITRISKANSFNFERLVNDGNRYFERKPINQITTERSGGIPPGIFVVAVSVVVLIGAGILYKFLRD